MNQKKALGRGLSALIPQKSEPVGTAGLSHIPLDRISANPYQPRKAFSERSIDELARSVRVVRSLQEEVVVVTGTNVPLGIADMGKLVRRVLVRPALTHWAWRAAASTLK